MVAGEFSTLVALVVTGLGSAACGTFICYEVSEKGCRWLALGALGLAWGGAALLWFQTGSGDLVEVGFYQWADIGGIQLGAGIRLDSLAATTLFGIATLGLVTGVFCLAHLPQKENISFFLGQLCFIMGALWLTVLAGNFGFLLVGWELAGIGAYLLAGWRYPHFIKAAGTAFLMQRLGGGLLLLGCITLATESASLNFSVLDGQQRATDLTGLGVVGWFFLGGVALQILTVLCRLPITPKTSFGLPLVAFVQTALGGMVGIYLLVRGRYFLESAGLAGEAAITAGMVVALAAALVALAKRELGQVLAYSTLSQCGLLFAALGLGGYHGAVYHMWMHGFAKVLVFLVAGRAILAADGVTDLRQMGGLGQYLPYSYWVFLIGAASLAGVPPLGGFWSQMQIVLVLYEANRPWLWGSGCLVILLTAIYVFRLVGRIFWGSPHWVPAAGQAPERRLHTSLLVLAVPLVVCILGGLWPLWPGEGLEVLEGVSHVNVGGRLALLELGAIVSALTVVGAVLAWAVYSAPRPRPPQIRFFTQLARHGFYLEQGFKILVLRPLMGGGRFLRDIVDSVLIEGVGFGGGLLGGRGVGWILARLHNGRIDICVLAMLVGLVSIVTYLFWDVE